LTELVDQTQQGFSILNDGLLPFIIPGVGAAIGSIGTQLVYSWNSKRQYGVAEAEFLCKQIDEIRELSLTYWKDANNDCSKLQEARINGMLHGCAEIIGTTNLGTKSDKKVIDEALRQFRSVCTSGSFGQVSREACLVRLVQIETEGRTFYAKVMALRRS
jgi:hypothetical protein